MTSITVPNRNFLVEIFVSTRQSGFIQKEGLFFRKLAIFFLLRTGHTLPGLSRVPSNGHDRTLFVRSI